MRNQNPIALNSERGFSLPELLVALCLTLVVIASAVGALQEAGQASAQAAALTDVNQTTRVAMNLIIKDLLQAGEGDHALRSGMPIPSGDGTDAIMRPHPNGSDWFFPDNYTALPAVSPADGSGILVNGTATDVLTILFEDRRLDFSGVTPAIADDGSSMTFPDDFDISDESIGIQEGDLIRFGNGAAQEVTELDGQRVLFAADVESGLNQRGAPQGSVLALKGGAASFPALPVSRVYMITYYLTMNDEDVPQLVRRVNYGMERVIAVGIENLQLSWDLVNGVDNPTNVTEFGDAAESQIRKANVYLAARSITTSGSDQQLTRATLTTQVSLRSLAFVSRYDIGQ